MVDELKLYSVKYSFSAPVTRSINVKADSLSYQAALSEDQAKENFLAYAKEISLPIIEIENIKEVKISGHKITLEKLV
jgi:hypothetical protein